MSGKRPLKKHIVEKAEKTLANGGILGFIANLVLSFSLEVTAAGYSDTYDTLLAVRLNSHACS